MTRLLLEQLLPQNGELIHHCAWHGELYSDEIDGKSIVKLSNWGITKGLPLALKDYNITSGICLECSYKIRYK